MKSNFRNYFKDNKLYQWNKDNTVYSIQDVNTNLEFCLDKNGMDLFLKFNNPNLTLDKNLKIKSGDITASIPLVDASLYIPKIEMPSEEEIAVDPKKEVYDFSLNIDILTNALKFVSGDTKKPILTGINISNGRINATDTFSAYSKEIIGLNQTIDITIPKEFIDEIVKAANQKDIICQANNKLIKAVIDGIEYYSVLLEGNYPNVASLYAKHTNPMIVANSSKQEIQNILSYAMINEGIVALSDYQLSILGENTEIKAACNLPIEDLVIYVSLDKFKNAIATIPNDNIEFSIFGEYRALLVNKDVMILPIKKN